MKDTPLSLVIAQAKQEYMETINAINTKYNLSASIIELIFDNIINQIRILRSEELKHDLAEYEEVNKEEPSTEEPIKEDEQ